MIRVTKQQASTLKRKVAGKPLEREVKKACIDMLEASGWRCIRLHQGTASGHGAHWRLGKKSDPDWWIMRPFHIPGPPLWISRLEGFYLELKKPGEEPSEPQLKRHGELRAEGYLVAVADDVAELQDWMARQGLL